jgi:hypothetical protein
MLAGRVADDLIDAADVRSRDPLNLAGIRHPDQDATAFAVGESHHFRGKGIHVADIQLELQPAVLSPGDNRFQFGYFHFSIMRLSSSLPPAHFAQQILDLLKGQRPTPWHWD